MPGSTTEALTQRAVRGDRAAFEALLALHGRTMLAVARARSSNSTDAEEILQESSVRTWQNIGKINDTSRFVAWACSIVDHVARDRSRRERVREAKPLDDVSDRERGPSEAGRNAIVNAVSSLPVPLREVIELFYFGNLTYREIADIIGKSVPTVNLRLAEARTQLRLQLKDSPVAP
ncbi:MAG: RNA polymerase sigma factor [Planctomycetota bacterium]